MSNTRLTNTCRFLFRMAKVATIVLYLGWTVGQLLLDGTWLTQLLFYIPSAAIFAILGVGALVGLRKVEGQSRQRISITMATALLAAGVMVFCVENQFFAPAIDPPNVLPNGAPSAKTTIVHWNTCSGRLGQDRVLNKLTELDADFYLLSEPPYQAEKWIQAQEHSAVWLRKMMAVTGKGDTIEKQPLVSRDESQIWSLRWTHDGKTLHIFAVDLTSDLTQHRNPLLQELNQLIQEHQPDLVVGDFNAPRRSIQLQRLPKGYAHAYDVAGREIGYTWPAPLPVYAIDQCIVGTNVEVFSYDLQTSFSDHRLQRLEISRQ